MNVKDSVADIQGTAIIGFCYTPILHTWLKDSCFTCDGSPTIQVFPLIFYIGVVI